MHHALEYYASKPWYVYILKCCDGSLYTGISKDVGKRVSQHNSGKGAKYTRSRHPVKLVYTEKRRNHKAAMKRELEIKKLPRNKKLKLIKTKRAETMNNPDTFYGLSIAPKILELLERMKF